MIAVIHSIPALPGVRTCVPKESGTVIFEILTKCKFINGTNGGEALPFGESESPRIAKCLVWHSRSVKMARLPIFVYHVMSFSSMVMNISTPRTAFYESARSQIEATIEKLFLYQKRASPVIIRHISEEVVGTRIYGRSLCALSPQ